MLLLPQRAPRDVRRAAVTRGAIIMRYYLFARATTYRYHNMPPRADTMLMPLFIAFAPRAVARYRRLLRHHHAI